MDEPTGAHAGSYKGSERRGRKRSAPVPAAEPAEEPGAVVVRSRATYHVQVLTGRQSAVCACGWISRWVASAGIAGALWDQHIAGDHPGA